MSEDIALVELSITQLGKVTFTIAITGTKPMNSKDESELVELAKALSEKLFAVWESSIGSKNSSV